MDKQIGADLLDKLIKEAKLVMTERIEKLGTREANRIERSILLLRSADSPDKIRGVLMVIKDSVHRLDLVIAEEFKQELARLRRA